VLTEAINSRLDAYSSTIRLCARTYLVHRHSRAVLEGKQTRGVSSQWQSALCGEGKRRTPAYDNRKSVFITHLQSNVILGSSNISAGKIQE
jgi:hypothetical protein